jgi:autophagy-related protein 5
MNNSLGPTLHTALSQLLPSLFSQSSSQGHTPIIIIHGLKIPLETPVGWIAENMSYPDTFIHVVLRLEEGSR